MEEVGRLAREARETIFATRVRLEAQAERYPENPAAHLAELQGKSNQADAEAQAASELESKATESAEELEQARGNVRLALRVIETLTPPALSLEVLEPIAAKAEEIGQEETLLTAKQDALVAELSRVPADDDGPASTEVETAIAQLDSLLRFLVGDAEAKAEELRKSREEAQRKIEGEESAAQSAQDAAKQVDAHGRDRERLAEVAEMARSRREAVAARWDACSASGSALDEATGTLAQLQGREGELETQHEDALAECKRFERALSLAEDHLALAQRANLAAAAAGGLHPGEDCPICSRRLEPEWVAPANGDLDEARGALKKAERGAQEARTQATGLEAQRQSLRERIEETEISVRGAEKSHEVALSELARMVDLEVETELPERAKSLEPFDAAAAVADSALTVHGEEHEQLVEERQGLETAARVAEESSENAEAALVTSNREAAQALERLAGAVRAIPEAFKLNLPLPEDPVELVLVEVADIKARRAAAVSRRTVLADRASERKRLQGELSPIQAALVKLGGRRHREVELLTADVVRQVNDHRDALLQAASQLELTRSCPGP